MTKMSDDIDARLQDVINRALRSNNHPEAGLVLDYLLSCARNGRVLDNDMIEHIKEVLIELIELDAVEWIEAIFALLPQGSQEWFAWNTEHGHPSLVFWACCNYEGRPPRERGSQILELLLSYSGDFFDRPIYKGLRFIDLTSYGRILFESSEGLRYVSAEYTSHDFEITPR